MEKQGEYVKHLQTLDSGNMTVDMVVKEQSNCTALLSRISDPLDKSEHQIKDFINLKYQSGQWRPIPAPFT